MKQEYILSAEDILHSLETSAEGLTTTEAVVRQETYGPN